MKIAEKVEIAKNSSQLVFHKEGIFYKLYNQDAFYFTEKIKPLKVQYKWFKNINEYVFIVGFPVSHFENLTKKLQELATEIDANEKMVKLLLNDDIDIEVYTSWKTKYYTTANGEQRNAAVSTKEVATTVLLINKLLAFQISNNTPMEAMLFLANLQKEAKIIKD